MSSRSKNNKTKVQKEGHKNTLSDEQMYIDEIDRKILKILNWNARLSYREIARQTKLSTGTVISRLEKLQKNGVITGYYANVDAKKLGYTLGAIIEVIATKGMFLEAAQKFSAYPNVSGVYAVSGDSDAIVVAKFRDSDHLNEFLKELNKDSDVVRTGTHIVLKAMKEDPRFILD